MKKKFSFMPKKPDIFFKCIYGVYKRQDASGTSICYTTNKDAAWLVSIALNRFLNSSEGEKWLKAH